MYEKHFSLKFKPFELVPNPDFLFPSSTHKKAITYLDYGIKEKIGFILLTGEIGSGKTTIIRNLIKNLDGSAKLSRIHNTKVSSEQLISMVNEDFGLDIEGKSKTRLLSELNGFLIEQYTKKTQPILLIDEAQNLSPDLLEEVRLLSNLETDKSKLLQIILVGQPELKRTLMLPELLQLRQRINISYHISPLTIEETSGYIKHRLAIAGNPAAIRCDEDIIRLIHQFSRGVPRLINILCDFALLSAFVEGKTEVTSDIIRDVTKDLESSDYWNESRVPVVFTGSEKQVDSDLSKITGDIALRLIKLEETVKNNLSEIVSLTNKMVQVEKDILKLISVTESAMAGLLERVARLERMPVVLNVEKKDDKQEDDNENYSRKEFHRFGIQVESLKDAIHFLNKKIKSQ
ncbi:MAG: AAA family ATPase [Nitrospirae bacterium]|nr:AAA family ATPase [Nitrospirota bacterium]